MTGPREDLSSYLPEEAAGKPSEVEGETSKIGGEASEAVEGVSAEAELQEVGDETSFHCK